MEDFSKILYENLDSVDQAEIASTLSHVIKSIEGKKAQSSLLNQMILVLNDVFDAYQPPNIDPILKD